MCVQTGWDRGWAVGEETRERMRKVVAVGWENGRMTDGDLQFLGVAGYAEV